MPSPTASGSVTTFATSADSNIVALLNEDHYRWGSGYGQPPSVTYSFPRTGSAWAAHYSDSNYSEPSFGFAPLGAAQEARARTALSLWGEVANLNLSELAETQTSVGDIRIAFSRAVGANAGSSTWGYAYLPWPGLPTAGDIWIDDNYAATSFAAGGYDFTALLHEIGHALGLKHPFEGTWRLPAATDTREFTLMSYTDSPNYPQGVYAQTPMVYDIRAIQYLYGANMTTRAGDDAYTFSPSSPTVKTIWDAGGTDTLDAGSFTAAVTLDLHDGHYSSIGLTENVGIAYGAMIENAVGGAGDDSLIGNWADNLLDGGGGLDTAEIASARGSCTITALRGGFWHVTGPGGHDTLKDIETIRFSDGAAAIGTLGAYSVTARQSAVAELYVALFGRAPERSGLDYWTGQLTEGEPLVEIANTMYGCAPARAYYPLDSSNGDFVTRVYNHVLGREPDTQGLAYWQAPLDGGQATRASIVVDMIDATKNYNGSDSVALMAHDRFLNRVTVAEYYGAIQQREDIGEASGILQPVDHEDASVGAALASIDTLGAGVTLVGVPAA